MPRGLDEKVDAVVADDYKKWKTKYAERYDGNEDKYRLSLYNENYKFVQEFNAKETGTLRLGMTKFAALSNDEYRALFLSDI
jgi:cathepsin L